MSSLLPYIATLEPTQLTLDEYGNLAAKTAICSPGLLYPTLKLSGEAGEFSEKIGKILRARPEALDGFYIRLSEAEREALIKELGDVMWYCARLAYELGTTPGEVALRNLIKTHTRLATGTVVGDGDNREQATSTSAQ